MSGLLMETVRIVIADDVADIRDLLKVCLIGSEFDVVGEAGDGAEAIRMVTQEEPQAIVLDLSMPVMDGLQAIPEIRRASPGTKILVLSGFSNEVMEHRALSLGADAYLEKGTGLEEVAPVLRTLCI